MVLCARVFSGQPHVEAGNHDPSHEQDDRSLYTSRSRSTHSICSSLRTFYSHGCKGNAIKLMLGCVNLQ